MCVCCLTHRRWIFRSFDKKRLFHTRNDLYWKLLKYRFFGDFLKNSSNGFVLTPSLYVTNSYLPRAAGAAYRRSPTLECWADIWWIRLRKWTQGWVLWITSESIQRISVKLSAYTQQIDIFQIQLEPFAGKFKELWQHFQFISNKWLSFKYRWSCMLENPGYRAFFIIDLCRFWSVPCARARARDFRFVKEIMLKTTAIRYPVWCDPSVSMGQALVVHTS